jgi:EmrB/QacA subfamily drug resistance transporter
MHRLEHKQKLSIMYAIMAAMLFAALNQTTVGTALPHIITDLGGLEYFSWIFTAYILAASIPAVIVGRLSDIYGRKPFILLGIGIFIIGSVLAGLATSIVQLIVFRVIQGVGGGIIMATSFTAVGDLFPPRQRGRWQGMLGATFGLASVFGPTLGGYIVDHWHWKWVFWVFSPLGLVAFVMIMILFPSVPKKHEQKIDYLGSALLTTTVVPLLLAFSWAGQRYAWGSLQISGLLLATAISIVLFILAEKRARHPILPLELFGNSVFTISNLIVFVMGASMFGALLYMPLFLQGVMGFSATVSGSMIMPMTLSLVAASILGGQAMSRSGKYKNLAFFGLAVTTVGMYLLSTMTMATPQTVTLAYIVIVGLGLGIGMPVFNLAVQNAVDHGHLGVATATGQLFRQLGGTIGVALMGTVMAHTMHSSLTAQLAQLISPRQQDRLPRELVSQMESPQLLLNPGKLAELSHTLPADLQTTLGQVIVAMREALNTGLSHVFLGASAAMLLAVVLVVFLKEIPLRTTMHKVKEESKGG